jgi:tetratricopeptide (TPR) repeat protein
MDKISSMLMVHRIYSILMQVLTLAILCFPLFSIAHVSTHDEIERLSSSIGQDPGNSQLYVSRGEAYRLHRNWDGAITDFKKALYIDQGNVAAATGLGRTFLDQGYPQQAIVQLNRALTCEPGNVRALIIRAQANSSAGKPLKAAVDYTRAIEQSREHGKPLPEYYLECARAYASAGDQYVDKALQCLDGGVKVLGHIRALELYAVELETGRGDFDAALVRLDSVIARAARKEFLLLQRGDILAAAGRPTAATHEYFAAQEAIDALPPQRRYSPSVSQLQIDLATRLTSRQ